MKAGRGLERPPPFGHRSSADWQGGSKAGPKGPGLAAWRGRSIHLFVDRRNSMEGHGSLTDPEGRRDTLVSLGMEMFEYRQKISSPSGLVAECLAKPRVRRKRNHWPAIHESRSCILQGWLEVGNM